MLVSQLSWPELQVKMRGPGLTIRTGPFVTRLRSAIPLVVEGVSLLYADFPVAAEDEFVDYTISVNRSRRMCDWFRFRADAYARGDQDSPFVRFTTRLALSFLEWGLNYTVYGDYNPYLVLHAAVLERGGRAVIILGDAGAGKSTLCCALALSGWRLLSDELGLVSLTDGLISPLARPVSLKNESVQLIQSFSPEAVISRPRWTRRKGMVAHLKPPADSVRRMDEPAEPAWLVLVKYVANSPLIVKDVPRSRAFAELLRSGFNYGDLGEVGFRQACQLIDRCQCYAVQYSRLPDVMAHFDSSQYRAG